MNNRFNPFASLTSPQPYGPPAPNQQPYNPFAGPSNVPQTLGQLRTPDVPQSYQVREGDTFASIASTYGIDEQKIQSYNKMVVPPPKGSYISLQPGAGTTSARAQQSQNRPPTVAELVAQGLSPTVAASMVQQQAQATGSGSYTLPTGSGPIGSENRVMGGANVGLTELANHYKNQIANGQAPKSIPSSMLGSLNATAQSMIQGGYSLNLSTNTWELGAATLPGAPGPGYTWSGGAWHAPAGQDPNSNIRSVYYSKSRGNVTPEVAALLDKRRRRRAEENRAKPILSANAGGTPTSTLEMRMESG